MNFFGSWTFEFSPNGISLKKFILGRDDILNRGGSFGLSQRECVDKNCLVRDSVYPTF